MDDRLRLQHRLNPGAINIPFENVVEDETVRAQEDLRRFLSA